MYKHEFAMSQSNFSDTFPRQQPTQQQQQQKGRRRRRRRGAINSPYLNLRDNPLNFPRWFSLGILRIFPTSSNVPKDFVKASTLLSLSTDRPSRIFELCYERVPWLVRLENRMETFQSILLIVERNAVWTFRVVPGHNKQNKRQLINNEKKIFFLHMHTTTNTMLTVNIIIIIIITTLFPFHPSTLLTLALSPPKKKILPSRNFFFLFFF